MSRRTASRESITAMKAYAFSPRLGLVADLLKDPVFRMAAAFPAADAILNDELTVTQLSGSSPFWAFVIPPKNNW